MHDRHGRLRDTATARGGLEVRVRLPNHGHDAGVVVELVLMALELRAGAHAAALVDVNVAVLVVVMAAEIALQATAAEREEVIVCLVEGRAVVCKRDEPHVNG